MVQTLTPTQTLVIAAMVQPPHKPAMTKAMTTQMQILQMLTMLTTMVLLQHKPAMIKAMTMLTQQQLIATLTTIARQLPKPAMTPAIQMLIQMLQTVTQVSQTQLINQLILTNL